MTFEEYIVAATQYAKENPSQRTGQAYMNALLINKRSLADLAASCGFDPFYHDGTLPAFLTYVGTFWDV